MLMIIRVWSVLLGSFLPLTLHWTMLRAKVTFLSHPETCQEGPVGHARRRGVLSSRGEVIDDDESRKTRTYAFWPVLDVHWPGDGSAWHWAGRSRTLPQSMSFDVADTSVHFMRRVILINIRNLLHSWFQWYLNCARLCWTSFHLFLWVWYVMLNLKS